MKTKILSLLTALALLLLPTTAALAQTAPSGGDTQPYTDVTYSTPHALAIYELTALGVVSGFPGGAFMPNAPLTRAQFAVMALGTAGEQHDAAQEAAYLAHKTPIPPGGAGCYPGSVGSGGAVCPAFSDVPPTGGAWYTPAVYLALRDGLVHGFPNGTFRPDAGVTLQQALTVAEQELIHAAAQNVGGNSPLASLVGAGMAGVSWGQVPAVAEQSGLLVGLNDRSWSAPITRGQAAQILADLLGANVGTAADPQPYLDGAAGAGIGPGSGGHYLYLSASAPGYVAVSPVEYLTSSDTPAYEIVSVTTSTGGGSCPSATCGGGSVIFLSSAPLSPIPPADTPAPAPLPPASITISGGAPIMPGQPIQLTATFTASLRNADGQPVTALPAGDSIAWQLSPSDTGAAVTSTGPLTASVTLPASPPGTWLLEACVQNAAGCAPISNLLTLTNSL